MIGSLDIGGSQTMVMNLYRNIDRTKIQFDFIIDHPQERFYAEEIESLGGRIYTMPTFLGSNILQVRKAWNTFFKSHPEYKILHSHVRSYATIYVSIAKKYGLKTIVHSHSTSNGSGVGSIVKAVLQYPLRYQADYYMGCSKEAGEWLFGKNVIKRQNFYIINNAIDAKKFRFDKQMREKYRNEFNIGDDFVVGFLGRVTIPKNPSYVIEIFNEILKLYSNSKLLFVGDGDLLPDIKKLAVAYGLEKQVIFTGARSDTAGVYAAMDVYCFPSLWEGLGISLVEAQASGLPCICSENIPQEAIITSLVHQQSLNDGASIWARQILSLKNEKRADTYELIRKLGYDIKLNAEWIQNFYMKYWN